jgi:hypothetical protein
MLCLPEFYVYGWIFNIQSSSSELLRYKWACYRVLYEHFHGAITGRQNLLRQKAAAQLEIEQVFSSLDSENVMRFDKARRQINQINARLREMDGETLEEERNLFNS